MPSSRTFHVPLFSLRLKLLFCAPFLNASKKTDSLTNTDMPDDEESLLRVRHNGISSPVKSLSQRFNSIPASHQSSFYSSNTHGHKSNMPRSRCNILMKLSLVLFFIISILALSFFAPFWIATAAPIPVNGTTDTFTIAILSYGPRLPFLRGSIKHYSTCPSVSNILVIWNGGVPLSTSSLPALPNNIPLRIRIEERSSLNNRFKPDPLITTKTVLSLDDDIRIPCRDIEEAFALYRREMHGMVGFFPRLIEGSPNLKFRGEPYAIENEKYNVILTGAAFLDAQTLFTAYWQDTLQQARDVVDDVFNGEDILMNFVVANMTRSNGGSGLSSMDAYIYSPVKFYQPSRRLDISKLSMVGISHNMQEFLDGSEKYLKRFVHTFRGNPLVTQQFEWSRGKGRRKPWFCRIEFIGCMYL